MFNGIENKNDDIDIENIGSIDDLMETNDKKEENLESIQDEKKKFDIKSFIFEGKKNIVNKFNEFIDEKGYTEQKELIFYEIRDNIILLGILGLTLVVGFLLIFNTGDFIKDYKSNLIKLNSLKSEIQITQKKIEGNKNFKDFSNLLQYGVEKDGKYYPEKGYLVELKQLYPTKEDLKFGTFTEGWTSDFKDWRGEKIRIPKDILKEYKVIGEEDIDENTKEIKYGLKLQGKEYEINNYLSLLSNLKLITNIPEIVETQDNGIASTEVTISFLLSK